jgi:hypothetical protein
MVLVLDFYHDSCLILTLQAEALLLQPAVIVIFAFSYFTTTFLVVPSFFRMMFRPFFHF